MSLQKKYLKTKPVCKVTFELPAEQIGDVDEVILVGEFTEWTENGMAMKKTKSGTFSATVELPAGKQYQFRYLINGKRWENDPQADAYTPNNVCGADNSVVVV